MLAAFRKRSGFSLIELSLVLAIVGLMAAAGLETYRGYIRVKIKNDTDLHRDVVTAALAGFVTNYNRLPCPADPTLAPGALNAGLELCPPAAPAVPTSGIVRTPGGRQTSANPAFTTYVQVHTAPPDLYGNPVPGFPADPVLIGSIPYVTLGISVRDSLDGWNNRFTYAVSEYLTRTATFHRDNGVVRIQQLQPSGAVNAIFNNVSVCPSGTRPVCNAPVAEIQGRVGAHMYVLVSHGRDGKGAYSYHGARAIACNSTPGRDVENCDDDSTFTDADKTTGIFSLVHNDPPGPDTDGYFDDALTTYTLSSSADKWSYQSNTSMYNKTKAKVGIGVQVPSVPLHVDGNIKADAVMAGDFCSPSWDDPNTVVNPDKPAYCFTPRMIDGPDGSIDDSQPRAIGCPNRVMNGIANGAASCAAGANLTGLNPTPCPIVLGIQQYAIGLSATGDVICASP